MIHHMIMFNALQLCTSTRPAVKTQGLAVSKFPSLSTVPLPVYPVNLTVPSCPVDFRPCVRAVIFRDWKHHHPYVYLFFVVVEGSVADPLYETLTLSHHSLATLRRVLYGMVRVFDPPCPLLYKELIGLLSPTGAGTL